MAEAAPVSVAIATDLGFGADSAKLLVDTFKKVDSDGSGFVDAPEVEALMADIGKPTTGKDLEDLIKSVDTDTDGKVSFREFCLMYASKSKVGLKAAVSSKHGEINRVKGAVGHHSYSQEEKEAFANHLNATLGHDEYLKEKGVLPIDPSSDALFRVIKDGIVMAKMINKAQAETIDERSLNYPKKGKAEINPWENKENQNLVINSAKAIGCKVVNLHASDLMETVETGKEYLVLGMIWQVVKIQLLSAINLKARPELAKLLKDDEELTDLMALPPEDVLLRWINYHMEKQGVDRRVKNFSSDLKDSEVYANLLNSITPKEPACDKGAILAKTGNERAAAVIEGAKAQGVEAFVKSTDITSGNSRLNLAFCAQIFNNNPGLVEDEEELAALIEAAGLDDEDDGDNREERVFRMWMNSLALGDPPGSVYINNLTHDLWDGIHLLETMEKVQPGVVNWKKVTKPKGEGKKVNKFSAVANCNYAIELAKGPMKLSTVGIGGVDVHNKNRKLILAVVWQLMRLQVLKLLSDVGGGKAPKDDEVISWANEQVEKSGKDTRITSFKDSSLANGLFLLDLLAAVEGRLINPEIVTPGSNDDEKKNNARYVISVARKLGAQVFLTWEDIVDVKPKMIMTLVASIQYAAEMRKL